VRLWPIAALAEDASDRVGDTLPLSRSDQRHLRERDPPLSSQGSLTFNRRRGLLYAVNAGSDTVSVFIVRGTTLRLMQVTVLDQRDRRVVGTADMIALGVHVLG
jgi:hypothetical protein